MLVWLLMLRLWYQQGQSPLHMAASRESPETLRLLLSCGADPNAVDGSVSQADFRTTVSILC